MGAASNGFYEACTMRGGRDSEIKTELCSYVVHSECSGLESACGTSDYVGSRARGTSALHVQLAPTSSPGLFSAERDIEISLQDPDMWSLMEGSVNYCHTLGVPALRSSDTGLFGNLDRALSPCLPPLAPRAAGAVATTTPLYESALLPPDPAPGKTEEGMYAPSGSVPSSQGASPPAPLLPQPGPGMPGVGEGSMYELSYKELVRPYPELLPPLFGGHLGAGAGLSESEHPYSLPPPRSASPLLGPVSPPRAISTPPHRHLPCHALSEGGALAYGAPPQLPSPAPSLAAWAGSAGENVRARGAVGFLLPRECAGSSPLRRGRVSPPPSSRFHGVAGLAATHVALHGHSILEAGECGHLGGLLSASYVGSGGPLEGTLSVSALHEGVGSARPSCGGALAASQAPWDSAAEAHCVGGAATAPALASPAPPHMKYLTPLSERKGKGGRQPAADPRNNPEIDPKKAQRIINNRMSAAKSKIKQKKLAQSLRDRLETLHKQRQEANRKVELVKAQVERENKRAMDLDLRLLRMRQEAEG